MKVQQEAKVKIAFYKGQGDWRNKTIRWWTKSEYSHAELVLPDDKTWVSISPMLSSRVAAREKTSYDPEKWDFLEFTITNSQLRVILNFFDDTKGCGYDWVGMIASQFLPFSIKRREKWYCSEWIAYAFRIAGVFHWREIKIYDRCDLSPGVLHHISKKVLTQKEREGIMNKKTQLDIAETLAEQYSLDQLQEAIKIKTDATGFATPKRTPVRDTHPGVGSGYAAYGSPFFDAKTETARSEVQSVDPFELDLMTQPLTGAYDEDLHGWIHEETKNKG
tara:strand:- start:1785 stop:2615 length:831 start_codon:yes stop_codon:yes gene_type:complete